MVFEVRLKNKKKILRNYKMSQTGAKPKLSIPCAETLQQACKLSIKTQNQCVFIFTLIPLREISVSIYK